MIFDYTKKGWKELWLKIAKDFNREFGKRKSFSAGFCRQLKDRRATRLADIMKELASSTHICRDFQWIYLVPEDLGIDDVRCLTACFIAEIGEKAFHEMVEVMLYGK